MAAGLQLVLTVDDDLFAGFKPAVDQRLPIADLRDGDGALFDSTV